MSLIATGVTIRIRETGSEFGMHEVCAIDLMDRLAEAGFSPLDADIPAVIIGPLFASADEWVCTHSACKVA